MNRPIRSNRGAKMKVLIEKEDLEVDDFWKDNPLFGSFIVLLRM